jgi:hypothetical protein
MDGVRLTVPLAPKISPGEQLSGHFGLQNKFKFVLQAKVLAGSIAAADRGPGGPLL